MKYNLRAVGYRYNPPLTQFSLYCANIDCPQPGSGVEFLKLTLDAMNSSATAVIFVDYLSDMLDMMANGTADITLMSIGQTLERMEKVQFTNSVGYMYFGYLVKELPSMEVNDYISSAFTRVAFFTILFFAVLVGVLLYIYTVPFKYSSSWNVINWLGQTFRALLNQSDLHPTGPIGAMILAASWLFFCFILLTMYQSKLQSFLSVTIRKGVPFTTMEGMIHAVKYQGYKMVLQDEGYSPFHYCNPQLCKELNQLKSKIVYIPGTESLPDKIASGKFIGFTAQEESYNVIVYTPDLRVLFVKDQNLEPVILAYAFRKNISGLQEAFNRALSITYGGQENIKRRYESLNEYEQQIMDTVGVKRPLHIYQMISLLRFVLELYGTAIVVLGLELALRRWCEEKILKYWRRLKKHRKITRIQRSIQLPRTPPPTVAARRIVFHPKSSMGREDV